MHVRLEEEFPQRQFTLKTIKATADQKPDVSLVALGGEGIFVKELEAALQAGEVDLVVHSLKDLPIHTPQGLQIAAVTEREDARDALVSRNGQSLPELPKGARVGTSSPRRKSQLLAVRSDLKIEDMRGNVDTRLRKLQEGRYDAIVLAACGLIRLGLDDRITEYLSFDQMLPEPGQGALAIETRADDAVMIDMVQILEHSLSRSCVDAERAFLEALGGGCRVPIGAFAEPRQAQMRVQGVVAALDGRRVIRDQVEGPLTAARQLGGALADRVRARGAEQLLAEINHVRL